MQLDFCFNFKEYVKRAIKKNPDTVNKKLAKYTAQHFKHYIILMRKVLIPALAWDIIL